MNFKTAGMNDAIISQTTVTNPYPPLVDILFFKHFYYMRDLN